MMNVRAHHFVIRTDIEYDTAEGTFFFLADIKIFLFIIKLLYELTHACVLIYNQMQQRIRLLHANSSLKKNIS